MKPKVTQEQWDQARQWLAEGMTQKQIAEKLGCKQPMVSRKLGKRRPKVEEQAAA